MLKHIKPAWTAYDGQQVLPAGGVDTLEIRDQLSLTNRLLSHVMRLSWVLGGMAAGMLCTLLALHVIPSGSDTAPDFGAGTKPVSQELLLATWENRQRLESLIRDVHSLSQAVAVLQDDAPGIPDPGGGSDTDSRIPSSVPPPDNSQAAATIATLQELPAPASGNAGKPRTAKPAPHARTEAAHSTPEAAIVRQDEWVVNLASLPSKEAAENLMAKVEAQDIPASVHKIKVQGKTYWRVQATGFESFTQAKTRARSIEEKLGTQGAWVMARANQAQ